MKWFYITFGVLGLVLLVLTVLKTDDTDKDILNRSGLTLYTDYGTGLQYLSTGRCKLRPRLDANGKQMRVKRNN